MKAYDSRSRSGLLYSSILRFASLSIYLVENILIMISCWYSIQYSCRSSMRAVVVDRRRRVDTVSHTVCDTCIVLCAFCCFLFWSGLRRCAGYETIDEEKWKSNLNLHLSKSPNQPLDSYIMDQPSFRATIFSKFQPVLVGVPGLLVASLHNL